MKEEHFQPGDRVRVMTDRGDFTGTVHSVSRIPLFPGDEEWLRYRNLQAPAPCVHVVADGDSPLAVLGADDELPVLLWNCHPDRITRIAES